MTSDQWLELVEWVNQRFPNKPWTPQQAVAYYHDIEGLDDTDVWAGLMRLYEDGLSFAPTGSQLVSAGREAARRHAREASYRRESYEKLPSGAEPFTLDKYTRRRFGEALSGAELVERIWKDTHAN